MNAFAVLCKSCRPDTVCSSVAWGRVWTRSVTFMSSSTTRNGTFSPGTPGRPRTGNFETNAKKDDKNALFLSLGAFTKIKPELVGSYSFWYSLTIWIKKFQGLAIVCSCQINNVQMYKGSRPRYGFKVKLSNFMPLIHFSFLILYVLCLNNFNVSFALSSLKTKRGVHFANSQPNRFNWSRDRG